MFRWIVGSSLKFRFLVVAIAAGMVAFGVDRFRGMPVDVFPEFAPPRVEIQTPSLGLSTAEVEELVTVPLEQAFNGLPGLDVMRSKSVPQLSSILLQFERGTDLLLARQLVAERLAVATPTLPTWASPARHAPAAVVDEPDDEDRHFLEGTVGDRHVDDRLLEDRRAPAARARRGECRHLGRAAQDADGAGRAGTVARARRDARRGHGGHRGLPDCGVVILFRRRDGSAPEGSSIPPIKGSRSGTSRPSSTRRSWLRSPSR